MSKGKQKLITFTDRELEIADEIKKKEGHGSFAAVIHSCLLSYWKDQYYNKRYMDSKRESLSKEPEEKLTNEQLCEKLGGRVCRSETSGMIVCQFKAGALTGEVHINQPEGFAGMKKQLGL